MKIIKFGSSALYSSSSVKSIRNILVNEKEPHILIIAAFSGITDSLIRVSNLSAEGKENYNEEVVKIINKHYCIINDLDFVEQKKEELLERFNILAEELHNILKGVFLINDLSPKTLNKIISYGERMSLLVIESYLADYKKADVLKLIKTNYVHGKAIPNFEITNKAIQDFYKATDQNIIAAGFICTDMKTGEITNLGRGGADYTAAIFAAALDAKLLEIWTDIDGFRTADPKIISHTHVLKRMTYEEATELCNFGAKIIYPPTIFPVFHKNIPIQIRNIFNPELKGTLISNEKETQPVKALIKGISSIKHTCLITIQGLGMVGVIGVNYRIFKVLAENDISVFLVAQASSENSTSIGIRSEDALLAVNVLSEEFKNEIAIGSINKPLLQEDVATVAIVGENMRDTAGVAGKLFFTLGKNGISVIASAQGSSEINISFVIKRSLLNKALHLLHDAFFLSDFKVLNLFIAGVGTVGGDLIKQIKQQQQKLIDQFSLKLNVIGLARSNKTLFSEEGILLDTYENDLQTKGEESSPKLFLQRIVKMNMYNAVFVDCTASETIAALYYELIKNNVSVVTANKIAASSGYEAYIKLKETARGKNIKFLFETNVGAGLPIINTMNSLINSGDKIVKIEAVLSGTLNFIFNTLSKNIPFSKAILLAKEEGFAEPDPRIDLSGKDVIRKLVILVREAGYKIEQDEVIANLFVPEQYFKGSIEAFWENIGSLDEYFEDLRIKLEKENKKLRFVAKYENNICSVGLEEINQMHPFYDLEGSNNIIMLQTERYNEYPMIIKGYGAGASVTAAGVFSDIISIANVR